MTTPNETKWIPREGFNPDEDDFYTHDIYAHTGDPVTNCQVLCSWDNWNILHPLYKWICKIERQLPPPLPQVEEKSEVEECISAYQKEYPARVLIGHVLRDFFGFALNWQKQRAAHNAYLAAHTQEELLAEIEKRYGLLNDLQKGGDEKCAQKLKGLSPDKGSSNAPKTDPQQVGADICSECKWCNTNLLNVGIFGKPRWLCHGCISRLINATKQPDTTSREVTDEEVEKLMIKLNCFNPIETRSETVRRVIRNILTQQRRDDGLERLERLLKAHPFANVHTKEANPGCVCLWGRHADYTAPTLRECLEKFEQNQKG